MGRSRVYPDDRSRWWEGVVIWLIKGRRPDTHASSVSLLNRSLTRTLQESVGTILDGLIPSSPDDATITTTVGQSIPSTFAISSGDLRKGVWLQRNSAPGDDGITIRIVKRAWPTIGQLLASLFSDFVRSSTFPTIWKSARVLVQLKSADKDPAAIKSYRPISLLSVLGKLLEHIICQVLDGEVGPNVAGV